VGGERPGRRRQRERIHVDSQQPADVSLCG
jgi:hypothetical protein